MHNKEIIKSKDGISLPRLTVAIRGFKSVFNIKTSKIFAAGYEYMLNVLHYFATLTIIVNYQHQEAIL